MNSLQQFTKEFHEKFGHPIAEKPTPLSSERAVSRTIWTLEELVEFLAASSRSRSEFVNNYMNLIRGLEKAFSKSVSGEFPQTEEEMLAAQADALSDALYFIFGTSNEMGIDIEKIFKIVHDANLSKLFTDENGEKYAKYDENNGGKVIKSPDFYQPEPFIKEEILRQLQRA